MKIGRFVLASALLIAALSTHGAEAGWRLWFLGDPDLDSLPGAMEDWPPGSDSDSEAETPKTKFYEPTTIACGAEESCPCGLCLHHAEPEWWNAAYWCYDADWPDPDDKVYFKTQGSFGDAIQHEDAYDWGGIFKLKYKYLPAENWDLPRHYCGTYPSLVYVEWRLNFEIGEVSTGRTHRSTFRLGGKSSSGVEGFKLSLSRERSLSFETRNCESRRTLPCIPPQSSWPTIPPPVSPR